MSDSRADLHLHSCYSDGKYSCEEVVKRAHLAGITILAITDHDTVDGLFDAAEACRRHDMELISGSEISAAVDGEEIHLLAYHIDPKSDGLEELFRAQKALRIDRAHALLYALRKAGLAVPLPDEMDIDFDGTVGRPHIARLILESGAAVSIEDAFERYLTPGAVTFVPKAFPEATAVIDLIHIAGGRAVIAHPGDTMGQGLLQRLIDAGLDGIEVVHPSHDEILTTYYRNQARKFDLLETGGSDYHGWRDRDEANLGTYFVPWISSGNYFNSRTL